MAARQLLSFSNRLLLRRDMAAADRAREKDLFDFSPVAFTLWATPIPLP